MLEKKSNGITGVWGYDNMKEFKEALKELEEDKDFSPLGTFNTIEDIDDELIYQGFTLNEIATMNKNQYGNVIEVLQEPNNGPYWVFVGAR